MLPGTLPLDRDDALMGGNATDAALEIRSHSERFPSTPKKSPHCRDYAGKSRAPSGLAGLASGLANAVFLAAVATDWVNERCYGHRYHPEDGDDEEH